LELINVKRREAEENCVMKASLFVLFAKCYYDVQIKKDETNAACSTRGWMVNEYNNLVGKTEGKTLLGRAGYRWEDNIKMDLN
jgi:hypothetical protein